MKSLFTNYRGIKKKIFLTYKNKKKQRYSNSYVFQGGGSQITGGGSESWVGGAEIRRDPPI